jgi:hypothetical protein
MEAVVADIQLVEEVPLRQRLQEVPGKAVGVEVQQREIREQAQLL